MSVCIITNYVLLYKKFNFIINFLIIVCLRIFKIQILTHIITSNKCLFCVLIAPFFICLIVRVRFVEDSSVLMTHYNFVSTVAFIPNFDLVNI